MRFTCVFLVLLICRLAAAGQTSGTRKIVLIGNAGDASVEKSAYLDLIKKTVEFDSNTIVLYLGNNARPGDTKSLSREAAIIDNSAAKAFFIPGYNDWANGTARGYKSVLDQQKFLESLNNKNIKYYPGSGCPGPKEIDLGNDAVMLILDSQWWLHDGVKPDIESDCKFRTKEEILSELEDFPRDNVDKLVLFVTHHPFENTGVHSGTFGLKQHIFPLTDSRFLSWLYLPLPLAGSLYPISTNAISGRQGMQNNDYQSLASNGIGTFAGVKKAFREHPNTIFIAGQEHNLQLLQKEGHHYIISGATGAAGRIRHSGETRYAKQHQGFTVLEIAPDKKVTARFYLVSGGTVREDYAASLADYSKPPASATAAPASPVMDQDSTIARAGPRIAKSDIIKRVLIGKNYREEWGAPVKMRVLDLDKEKGGLKITGTGGGHESRSLQLEDSSGKKWVFRSLNKNLTAVIPEGFRNTVASEYVYDMLSAADPYGPLAIPALQSPFNIVQAVPQMYFLPDGPALKEHRPLFSNNVGLLEERKPALNNEKTVNTNVALNNMVRASDHFSDQHTYLNIRLIDFLIADFDRHHGQYSWGKIDSGKRAFYYPIPKDRDQSFYNNSGLVMAVMRQGDYKFQTNFPYRLRKMKNAGIVGAYLDKVFMNQLMEADWRLALSDFKTALTDSVVDAAVSRMPPEITAIRGDVIAAKLKSRRESIAKKGLDYYRFISRKVDVLGGNKAELFKISGTDSGLLVQVYAKDENAAASLRYSRTFDPAVTREIRLYGFNGDDYFDVDESARSHIRLRVVGGRGKDSFRIRGRIENHLYDLSTEDNKILARRRTTKMFSANPAVNQYRLRETLHNAFSLPSVAFGLNKDDGVVAGIGISYRTYGFRKYPYASRQSFATSYAFNSGAYMVRYNGEFIDIYRHYDLLLRAEIYDPVLRNFYGFGNETKKDTTKPVQFYRTRYDYTSDDLLVRKRFYKGGIMNIAAGPSFYHYWIDSAPNNARVLEHPAAVGLDSANVYSKKFYGGGKIAFTINTLNSDLLPVRGIQWTTDFTALKSLNNNSGSYTKLQSALDVYAELSQPARLLAALHFGGGHIFSEGFEYFQALTLGGNNYLRGYRVNRFSGSSMAYGSIELKAKLFNFNAYILKGDFGLVGFNDIGRVWMKGEHSGKWHHGYGGGIYLIPFNTLIISAVAGFSEEDQLFNFSIGTKINMVYQGI